MNGSNRPAWARLLATVERYASSSDVTDARKRSEAFDADRWGDESASAAPSGRRPRSGVLPPREWTGHPLLRGEPARREDRRPRWRVRAACACPTGFHCDGGAGFENRRCVSELP